MPGWTDPDNFAIPEQLYGFPLLLFGCNDILVVASALGK